VLINNLLEGADTPTSDTISKDELSSPTQGGEDLILTSTITVTAPSNVETGNTVTSSSTAEVTLVTSEEQSGGVSSTVVNTVMSIGSDQAVAPTATNNNNNLATTPATSLLAGLENNSATQVRTALPIGTRVAIIVFKGQTFLLVKLLQLWGFLFFVTLFVIK